MVREIPIVNRAGAVVAQALVDDSDFDDCAQFIWHLHSGGSGYGARGTRGGVPRALMHRYIMRGQIPDGMHIDHINGNGLDNRRENLRVVTHAENMQNRRKLTKGASAFRGVTSDRPDGCLKEWRARATLNGKRVYLGRYTTEEEAALAVSEWRAEHMPFAVEPIKRASREGIALAQRV